MILNFIFNNTYFSANNKIYKQVFGTPMGSKISPIISQYVMDDLLENCIPKLSLELPFLFKYVDDICAIPQGKQQEIINIFNSYYSYIQFTIENEN